MMAHVNILSLPIEILQLIGNVRISEQFSYLLLSIQDGHWQGRDRLRLKTLRLVCSQFNRAFEAQVLSTLVILVLFNTLKPSLDMLRTFASQNKETSRAVQHARTLKIKCLSTIMAIDTERFPMSMHEPKSQDLLILFPRPPSLIRRLMSALKRRFK